ncbi:MAG TPA: xanthine dehydrogenase family protein molybdopterin-binding subunit [Chloroflexota bacterium]|nr:xanthine dehydrogenase family protein molybdopterin-binding subunit [Chloroflexota bacterium]
MQQDSYRFIGHRTKRDDAPERLTGQTRFVNDLSLPGALHARFVPSQYASARILSIDKSEALAIPGVIAVMTARDLPVVDIEAAVEGRVILLALDRVIHAGQPVAAVLAETEAAAEDGVAAVRVEYEPLPVAIDMLSSMAKDSPVVRESHEVDAEEMSMHGATPQAETEVDSDQAPNVASRTKFQRGDVAEGFRLADLVVEKEFSTSWVHQGYMEPQSCSAMVDPLGNVIVYASTQALFHTRSQVAHALGLADHQVTLNAQAVGGGFGGKFGFLEATVAAMAVAVGRPVRMAYTRMEEFTAADPAPQSAVRVKIGATRDGTLTTLEGEMIFDAGAKAGAPVGIGCILLGSMYRWEHLQIEGVEVLTNKAGTGAYRGPGGPQAAFALESAVDEIAHTLGIDPLELRIKNAVRTGDLRADGKPWQRIGLAECLEQAREVYQSEREACGPGEGVGVALGGWPGAIESAAAACRLNADGTLQITLGVVDLTGTSTSFAMIAAEAFGLDSLDQVRVTTANTDHAPYAGGSGGSKITYTVGPAVLRAAQDARDQVLRIAAADLEVSFDDLQIANGRVGVKGVPAKSRALSEIFTMSASFGAKYAPVQGSGRTVISDFSPGMAVHVVRVRVDEETGRVVPLSYTAIQDVGTAINPATVEGQLEGGAVQAVGWGLFERILWDEQGTPTTGSLMDYAIPKASQSPHLGTVLVQVPSEEGPFGAKGVGEPPVIPGAAALANAVRDACGARVMELPITSERVISALAAGKNGAAHTNGAVRN